MELKAFERRQPELPPRRGAIHALRLRREMNDRLPGNPIESAVMERYGVAPHNRLIIVPKGFTRHAAHLEDIHEIGFVSQFDHELQLMEVEILKGKIIKQSLGREQLLTPDVHCVL